MAECEKAACNIFCRGKDVKRVQLRSQASGPHGPNRFDGPIVMMCSSCRKANIGGFKILPAEASRG